MTIERLIDKLRQASSEQWVYLTTQHGYDLIILGEWQTTVTKELIEPIKPNSFREKQLIDNILNHKYKIDNILKAMK